MQLKSDIKYVKGVGPTRAEAFYKLSVPSVGALLRYYPRAYEDWSQIVPIRDLQAGENACIRATVCHTPTKIRIPGGTLLFKTTVTDGAGLLNLTFFNNKYIQNQLKEGEEYLFFGKPAQNRYGALEMASPLFQKPQSAHRIRPIYPATAQLNSKTIERCVQNALDALETEIPDFLPREIREKNGLCTLDTAIRHIHFPPDEESLAAARKRLIFDELFLLQLGLLQMKSRTQTLSTDCVLKTDCTDEFAARLPFSFTGAQSRAVGEAMRDMQSGEPMNRLLQGDVGSGKTAVAAALIYSAAKNGFQSAMMAPTEVLAEQHYRTFRNFFAGTGIEVVLLTGSVSAAEKRAVKAKLKSGEAALAVGTHALIQEDVDFARLGLCITDEQHRFGVAQRASLAAKGDNPHILVMSATPIPRTLGLILYGDLNVSVLDELPPGRQTVDTYRVGTSYRPRIYKFIEKHIAAGLQAYIVCPLVEEGELDLAPAEEYCKRLQNGVFHHRRVGLLHGKMKPKEKDKIMRAFSAGEIDILVSTVVVEVGVDVPNAAVMVIENAERFGLSQLHQLRGRVGRGTAKSTCILVSDAQNDEAKARFDILCETNDGFKIADADLKLRGPGDFFGKRQHGLPALRLADILRDTELLLTVQREAVEFLKTDAALENPEHAAIKRQLDKMFAATQS
ncbi:MAG: ATP-dependent DNA helicase RecG [Candidatus Fimenecus sp.]